jgi:hypothetical protein
MSPAQLRATMLSIETEPTPLHHAVTRHCCAARLSPRAHGSPAWLGKLPWQTKRARRRVLQEANPLPKQALVVSMGILNGDIAVRSPFLKKHPSRILALKECRQSRPRGSLSSHSPTSCSTSRTLRFSTKDVAYSRKVATPAQPSA